MKTIKKYYVSLLVAVALPVILAALFGLLAGVISVFSLLVGTVIGAQFVANEVIDEMARVRAESGEQPFPLM